MEMHTSQYVLVHYRTVLPNSHCCSSDHIFHIQLELLAPFYGNGVQGRLDINGAQSDDLSDPSRYERLQNQLGLKNHGFDAYTNGHGFHFPELSLERLQHL